MNDPQPFFEQWRAAKIESLVQARDSSFRARWRPQNDGFPRMVIRFDKRSGRLVL
jgi:hypothetical protein